jgi:phosphocarrier protein HPr
MTTFSILLRSVNDVKLFVEASNRLSCEVDVEAGRYVVDGKSILGLFSINLAGPITVKVHGTPEEGAALKADVAAFLVE